MKKIVILGIVFIICIIATLGFVFSKKQNPKEEQNILGKTEEMYENIINSNFTFSMEELNNENDYKVTMVQRGEDVVIDAHSEGEHTSTILMNGNTYCIMHNEKQYYNYGNEPVDIDVEIYSIKDLIGQKYKSGNETIEGKKYYYEEFNNSKFDFITHLEKINEETTAKVRFYFDGDKLVYIKNIIDNGEKKIEEILKTNLYFDADESLFTIPKEYEEIK